MAVMNFRFAHYDPPKPKTKRPTVKLATNNKKGVRLPQRPSKAQQKRKVELARQKEEDNKSSTVFETDQLPTPPASEKSDTPRTELTTPSQALNTLLGQGRLDPFNLFPVNVISPYVQEVLDHAIHRKWANVSPTPTPTTVAAPTHPVKRGWYQCALSSPVAFYSLFYAASQHLNYLQHGADSSDHAPTLRFSYKTKAIALINRELPRLQGQPLSDALLISILSLGAHGNKPVTRYNTDTAHNQSPLASAQMLDFYGHIDQETVHMSALRKLLAYNKGIEGIELPGLVGALQLGDILHSTITNQTPTLAPRPCTLPRPIADFADKSAYPIKSSALPTSKHALKLLETLVEARALTAALEQYTSVHILHTSNERCEVSMDDLIHSRNLIHHTLISLPAANGLWGASFALYDCIRLASRIYSDLVFFPLPAETGVREGLAVQLRQALDYISLHNGWREETEALLWCCLLGAIAAEEVAGMEGVAMRGYIRNKVGMCADVLAIQSWEDQDGVETVCEKMLWWKHVCSGRGKAVWERLQ